MAANTKNALWIDPKSQFGLNGWIAVPTGSETSTQIVLKIDDLQPFGVRTRLFQKNVTIDGERVSRLKFTAIYPADLFDGRVHAIELINASEGVTLYSATPQFEDLKLRGRNGRKYYGGVHFVAKAGHIEGWIFDRDTPSRPVAVDLNVDGRRAGREFASITTPNMLVGGDERHGFRLQIPNAFVDGAEHRFEVLVDGAPLRAIENTFSVKAPDQSHQIDGIASFYARFETVGFEYLRGFVKTEARGSASLLFYVDDTLVSKKRLDQSLHHGLVEARFKIPDELYDGGRKAFSVRVEADGREKVIHTTSRIMSPKLVDQARVSNLSVADGRLKGKIAIPNDWTLEGEIALFAGDIRVGTSELTARPGGWGEPAEFSFDLTALSATPWQKMGVTTALIQPGAQRLDVLPALFAGTSVSIDGASMTISMAVPLTGRIKIGVQRPNGRERVIEIDCVQSSSIVQHLLEGEAAEANELKISLDGRVVRDNQRTRPPQASEPAAAAPAAVTGTLAPNDRSVVETLRAIALGAPPPADASSRRGKASGAWELAPPHSIVGWAVDLENPARTLVVSVSVDGKECGRRVANRPFQVSPDLKINRGFEIDTTRIDVPAGLRTFEIRFADTKVRLHPDVAAQLVFPGRSSTSSALDELDNLVAEGRIDDAATAATEADLDDASVAARHFAVDALSRRDWCGYDQLVDRLCGALDEDAKAAIKRLKPIVASGDVAALEAVLGALDLPQTYIDRLASRLLDRRTESPDAFPEAYARWIAAAQARRPAGAPPPVVKIVILDLTDEDERTPSQTPGAFPLQVISASTRKALAAEGSLTAAAVTELREAIGAADHVLLLGRPRFAPDGAEAFWPQVAINYTACDVTVIRRDARPTSSPERELDAWSAFVPTSSFDLVAAAAKAVTLGHARGLKRDDAAGKARGELVLISGAPGERVAVSTARLLCFHDFPDDMPLPAAPPGVHVARADWSNQGGLPTPGEIAAAIEAEGEGWNGGVVVLTSKVSYPPEYLFDCLRAFDRSGSGFAFHGLAYDGQTGRFDYDPYEGFVETSAAFLPLGCFAASVLVKGQPTGPRGELRIVTAERPFRIVRSQDFPKREERDAVASDFAGSCSPAEHRAGFNASLRERHHAAYWRFQSQLPPLRLPGVDDEATAALTRLGLRSALHRLANGDVAAARTAMRAFLSRRDVVEATTSTDLQFVLALVRMTGQQDELTAALLPHTPRLVDLHPDLIGPLLENAALVLEPDELAAVLIGCVPGALDQAGAAPAAKLLEISRRFCSETVMIVLLTLIDQSQMRHLLLDPDIQRTVGPMFASEAGPVFELANTRLSRKDLGAAAPNEIKLIAALLELRRADFLTVLNDLILDQKNLLRIARLLRTYTNELRRFGIRGREVDYMNARSIDEALQLALILGDLETAESHIALVSDGAGDQAYADPLQIVYNSTLRRYGALNQALRMWYARLGVAPLTLSGEDVNAVFASVFEDHDLPLAEDKGKVTLICTVYNTEAALLKISLRSMLSQTYRNIEIILVDDASDAEFAEGVAEAAALDPRIRLIRSPRNSGPYHGRNLAIAIATGEYVAIHDGDDIAHPQRIEHQVGTLAREPALEMATTGHLRIDTMGQVQFEHTLELVGDGTMTSMFRRSLFDRVGGFAEVRSRGDVEFRERVRRALGAHVISHTPAPLMFCLASPSSLSNTTAARYGSFLALYRDGFAKRVVRSFIDDEPCGSEDAPLLIPYPLRPTTPR